MTNFQKHKLNNLRRARFIETVLFGAFAYLYTSVLQGERLLAILRNYANNAKNIEQILNIEPWHIGLVAMTCTMLITAIFLKYLPPPHSEKRPLWKTLSGIFIVIFFFCLLTSPNEENTIEQKMERQILQGKYEDALKTGATRENPSIKILEARITALEQLSILNEDFFLYPIGNHIPIPFPGTSNSESSARKHLEYLLSRNLPKLGEACKTYPRDSLQRAEKEALVLYAHTWIHPSFVYTDTAIETNYKDFQNFRHKIRKTYQGKKNHLVMEANVLKETYGQTYWYYFYYGQHR